MRRGFLALSCLLLQSLPASAEVANVTITSRAIVAEGHSFGATGAYEKLVGRIEYALDPTEPHNARIVDLAYAPRSADGRVHFSSDLYVLRPVGAAKGNGVLLFEVANRGNKGMLSRFNRNVVRSDDPATLAEFGDGLLMREGYTLVSIGWELGLSAPAISVNAPSVLLPPNSTVEPINVDVIVNARATETFLIDEPARPPVIYPPADGASATDRLTVRDLFWDEPVVIPRDRWRFVVAANGIPKLRLDGGFDPGRWYRVTYRPTRPVVAGVGLAAIRDAAAAFRYRSDLPLRGRKTYAFGISQTGRFLRQFLYDGFNADERDRRVFDAVWVHIAGAARGSFNERFATPSTGDMFESTRFPFTDADATDTNGSRDGLLSRYRKNQLPKIFYTNTPVEYWGGGRAAALTHTTADGTRALVLPDNVRMYVLAGTQHVVGPFPPPNSLPADSSGLAARAVTGQELTNPTPQANVMRALLRALHQWASDGTPPPASRYPHDPLFRFHRWRANLRVLEIEELKSVPFVPRSAIRHGQVRKLGAALLAARQSEEAARRLAEAVDLAVATHADLEAAQARLALGLALAQLGRFVEGEAQLRQVIQKPVRSASRAQHLAMRNMGAVLRMQGRDREALDWLGRAIWRRA
jgi:hypothetical protein